jgi:hypothetical protein
MLRRGLVRDGPEPHSRLRHCCTEIALSLIVEMRTESLSVPSGAWTAVVPPSPMRQTSRALVLLAVAATIVMGLSVASSAHQLGGRWSSPQTT